MRSGGDAKDDVSFWFLFLGVFLISRQMTFRQGGSRCSVSLSYETKLVLKKFLLPPGWITRSEPGEFTCKLVQYYGRGETKKKIAFEKWEIYILIHRFHFLYSNSRVNCSKMYVTKSFLSSKLFFFLFLNVLVETKSLAFYDALLHHRKWFENKVGLTESHSIFLWGFFVFVLLWHGLGRRAEEKCL